jgi:hypothetical protein
VIVVPRALLLWNDTSSAIRRWPARSGGDAAKSARLKSQAQVLGGIVDIGQIAERPTTVTSAVSETCNTMMSTRVAPVRP